jgi:toxin secretion/phage lysis holin
MEKSIIGGLAGLAAYFAGLPWELIIIWGILMVFDIVTGILKSAKEGNWSSRIMKEGLLKKAIELTILFSVLLIQRVAIINGITVPLGSVIVGIFCFKEFGSILENYIAMGYKLPDIVTGWFKIAKEQIEKK